jgi:hypothetical protein
MGSIERRLKALETRLQPEAPAGSEERERIISEFMRRALDAMARIKRAPIDAEPYRYSVEKLQGESAVTVAAYVAALARLEHEDEDEAREVLARLVEQREIDPTTLEKLIGMFVGLPREA